jgi:putative transposase
LTTDWVLGQFGGKRGKAEQEYRKFIQWGIGQNRIWTEVRGQALLGEDGFVDKFDPDSFGPALPLKIKGTG